MRVNGKKSKEFWINKKVRQGYSLSPTLFTLYMANLEELIKTDQVGGIVIGREKIWALVYADDIMLLVKDER